MCLLDKLLKKDLIIFFEENKGSIFFEIDKDLYKIKFNTTIVNTKIHKNGETLDISLIEMIDILNLLSFIDRKYMSKHIKLLNGYIKKTNQFISFNILMLLKNKYPELNLNEKNYKKFFKINKFINSKYSKAHGLGLKESKEVLFKKDENKDFLEKIITDIEKDLFINICKSLLTCKDITLQKSNLIFLFSNYLIKYDLNHLSKIEFKNKIYTLNFEYIQYILFIIQNKDKSNKNINLFFRLHKHMGLKNSPKTLLLLDDSFSLFDINLYKTKIKIKKSDSEIHLKEESIIEKKESKLKIIKKNKNTNDFLFDNKGFGTLGELLGKQEVELKNEFDETDTEKAYFKPKLLNNKEKVVSNEIESLVLWDLENIHYFDAFSTISRYVKSNNQFKIIAFSEKYRNYETINTLNFNLNKLRKRNWIIKETKKIADDTLIEQFHKYKHSIKELIVISNDSDFQYIVKEANDLNIKTIVLHRHGRTKNSFWYDIASENISLKDIQ